MTQYNQFKPETMGNGKFRVRLLIEGKRKSKVGSLAECEQWYYETKFGVQPPAKSEPVAEPVAEQCPIDPTFAELIDRYEEEVIDEKMRRSDHHSPRPPTQNDRSQLRILKRWLGKVRLSQLNADRVVDHVVRRRKGKMPNGTKAKPISDSSINRELSKLSVILNTANVVWGYDLGGNVNPVRKARKIMQLRKNAVTENPSRERTLTDHERGVLYRSKHGYIFEFAVETCMRRNEIAKLHLCKRTGRGRHLLHIPAAVAKNRTERKIPLSVRAEEILKQHPNGFGVQADTLSSLFKTVVEAEGFEDLRFHDLRHDGITRYADMGLSIFDLKKISGHKSTKMLERYVNKDEENVLDKIRAHTPEPTPAPRAKLRVVR